MQFEQQADGTLKPAQAQHRYRHGVGTYRGGHAGEHDNYDIDTFKAHLGQRIADGCEGRGRYARQPSCDCRPLAFDQLPSG
jgi:hypothetical protein